MNKISSIRNALDFRLNKKLQKSVGSKLEEIVQEFFLYIRTLNDCKRRENY